jgi:hypothetical protein
MHVSKIEVQAISAAQVDMFYHHLIEIFPSRAEDLLDLINRMDAENLPNGEKWDNLLIFAFDWARYGN